MLTGYFVSSFQGDYIAGYKYYNGVRWVYLYITSVYKGTYKFMLDYTYAKTFSYKTAYKHMHKLHDMRYAETALSSC